MTPAPTRTTSLHRWQLGLLGIGVVALVACGLAAPNDFFRAWLIGYLPCWEVTVGCLAVLMLHHLTGGNWGWAARPALEAGACLLPLAAIGFIPIALELARIFPWASPEAATDPTLHEKAIYLNPRAFYIRAGVYFTIWIVIWLMLVPIVPRRNNATTAARMMPRRSALGLILLVVSVSFAAIDWAMSLEPHWFSAIYGAIFVAGGAVTALALAALAVAGWRLSGRRRGVRPKSVRRDLGSLLLALLMIWMYFTFSQFLIIWSADLPEENVWYLARGRYGWQYLVIVVFVLHFAVPFLMLLSQDVKATPRTLAGVAGLVLLAHVLYHLWLVAPAFYAKLADVPWVVVVAMVGMVCLWGSAWLTLLGRRVATAHTRAAHTQ